MSLFAELRRRNVFKVGTAYLALGWVVTQVTATVVPYMRLPEWTVPMVLWVGVIAFPFVLIFSWVYELTPEGLRREHEVERDGSITRHTGRKLDYLIVGLLVAAIAIFLVDRFVPREDSSVGRTSVRQEAEADVGLKSDLQSDPQQNVIPAQAGTQPGSTAAAQAPDDKSIAVLPFADMSAAKDQEYMSDGIAEELLNLLAKVPELRVIARTSSFAFKNKELELAEIAQRLNVANVLEGSVRTAGNRVRITAQLVRASDSSHLWSETYDRTLDDIFAVQDEIAAAVVSQLKLKLLGDAPTAHATDPRAYALWLQARQVFRTRTPGSSAKAVELVQQALAIAPDHAEAWSLLGSIYHNQANNGVLDFARGVAMAREADNKAIALNPQLALPYTDLGVMAWEYDNDAVAAATQLQHALALEPTNLLVLGQSTQLLAGLGRGEESLAVARYALERDPVNADRHGNVAYASFHAGDFDAAIAGSRAALALSPGRILVHYLIGLSLALQGHAEEAIAEMQQETDEYWRREGLAIVHALAGQRAESDKWLQELLDKDAQSAAANIAYVYAMRGQPDQAFEWLDKAVVTGDPGLSGLVFDRRYLDLHEDPRWLPFLRRLDRAPEQLAAIKFEVKLP